MYAIEKIHYYKNPFIGLFLETNDRHTLVPKKAPANIREALASLQTEQLELFVNQSPLLGLFTVLNSSGGVLCHEAENEEKRVLKKHGYNVYALKSSFAPGNVLLANDKAVFASMEVSKKELASIADCLGVEAFQTPSPMRTPGSLNVLTNKGLFAYNDITEVEFKHFCTRFGVTGVNGTYNSGIVFNALGVVANSRGALVGEATTGFEIQRIYEALSGE